VRGRSDSLGQKIASSAAAVLPGGRPDGRRSAALREPIDHRLDSGSFMPDGEPPHSWRCSCMLEDEAGSGVVRNFLSGDRVKAAGSTTP